MNENTWAEFGHDAVLRLIGAPPAWQFARKLEQDAQPLDDVIVELTVGETYFFREPRQFDFLRSDILPEIKQRRGNGHIARMWSAGCPSREEAYSLAMLCEREGLGERAHLLATDISSKALGQAREASYRDWSLRGEGARFTNSFLRLTGDRYQVDPAIRRRVQFEFLNLALDVYPSYVTGTMNLDLILCRNVLIYFNRETIREVARRFYDSLAPGGWLITASGDPPIDKHVAFESVVTDAGVFFRRPLHANVAVTFPKRVESPCDWDETASACSTEIEPRLVAPQDESTQSAAPRRNEREEIAETIEEAKAALLRGDYDRAADLTRELANDVDACVVHVKALANIDTMSALRACATAAQTHVLSAVIHYLHAVLLLENNLEAEAVQAAERAVYLDRTLAIAHFTLGSIRQRRGELDQARRHFRNTRNLCQGFRPDAIVALSEGETAQQLGEAAEAHLKICDC